MRVPEQQSVSEPDKIEPPDLLHLIPGQRLLLIRMEVDAAEAIVQPRHDDVLSFIWQDAEKLAKCTKGHVAAEENIEERPPNAGEPKARIF